MARRPSIDTVFSRLAPQTQTPFLVSPLSLGSRPYHNSLWRFPTNKGPSGFPKTNVLPPHTPFNFSQWIPGISSPAAPATTTRKGRAMSPVRRAGPQWLVLSAAAVSSNVTADRSVRTATVADSRARTCLCPRRSLKPRTFKNQRARLSSNPVTDVAALPACCHMAAWSGRYASTRTNLRST